MRLGELLELVAAHAARRDDAQAGVVTLRSAAGKPVTTLPGDVALTRICDITEDSRTVVPGSLFIARKGLKSDGKQYIRQAIEAGAAAILTDDPEVLSAGESLPVPVLACDDAMLASALIGEAFYGYASRSIDLIGVTGTNGKTTTTYLIWQLLNGLKRRCGLVGTVLIDDGVEVARAMMTTPPAIEVSRTLARMHEAGCVAATLEVSSHALDQKRVDALQLRVGLFSNLTGDHLDYHGTMEQYAAAKARLFALLTPDGVALVNALDPWHQRMIRDCKAKVCTLAVLDTVGNQLDFDYTCMILSQSMQGMEVLFTGPFGSFDATTSLIGRFNAFNLLAAVASTFELGIPGLTVHSLAEGIRHLHAPPGRLERVSATAAPIHVFVDYAHSDDSLAKVLSALTCVMPARHAGAMVDAIAGSPGSLESTPRLWCVFGCGGDRDRSKRPRMGLVACQLSDFVVITSDNPRSERPSDIVDQILAGIPAGLRNKVHVQVDRARAIQFAVEHALAGDVIVIAGKGHETEQILPDGNGGTITTHFDDREVARAALLEKGLPIFVSDVDPSLGRAGRVRDIQDVEVATSQKTRRTRS